MSWKASGIFCQPHGDDCDILTKIFCSHFYLLLILLLPPPSSYGPVSSNRDFGAFSLLSSSFSCLLVRVFSYFLRILAGIKSMCIAFYDKYFIVHEREHVRSLFYTIDFKKSKIMLIVKLWMFALEKESLRKKLNLWDRLDCLDHQWNSMKCNFACCVYSCSRDKQTISFNIIHCF